MQSKFIIIIVLAVSTAVFVSAKQGGKEGKGDSGNGKGKGGNQGKKSISSWSTCLGQSVDVSSQLQTVDLCLETRFNEIANATATTGDEKAAKKSGKKLNKKKKKLRKKCTSECEWKALGMLPDGNSTTGNGSSLSLPETSVKGFLALFPEGARASLKTGIETCLKTSELLQPKEGKNFNMVNQMCSKYKKLVQCFHKTVKKTCKGNNPPSSASGKSSSPSPANEDDDKDDDDDDDDNDDVNETTKSPTPSSPISFSTPITK